MAKVVEWRANTTGKPTALHDINLHNTYCYINMCGGLLDYIYGCMWRCRDCGRWHEHTPKV